MVEFDEHKLLLPPPFKLLVLDVDGGERLLVIWEEFIRVLGLIIEGLFASRLHAGNGADECDVSLDEVDLS